MTDAVHPTQCAGVLLTGGASRRMGTDKASIVFDGETLAVRSGRVLASVCDPVVEVGAGASGLDCVREDPPGSGPLAALVAGAHALGTRGPILLLACDLPFVDAALLELLAQWPGNETVVPMVDGRLQYVCARYGSGALAEAESALARGERSLRAVVETACDQVTEAQWRSVAPANALADVDTPEDLHRLGLS